MELFHWGDIDLGAFTLLSGFGPASFRSSMGYEIILRKYQKNVDDLLQSYTARTMLANSEFIVMLNQEATDRAELAKLLIIFEQLQLSYITNVDAGNGLMKVGGSLVPFTDKFPRHTKLYRLMTTKPGE
ncbi:hypothetical protein [Paenibacillus elgii]